jgi:hypothetical protein
MEAPLNSASQGHLPIFITAPGQTDVLMVITGIFLLAAVIGFGVLFFWLHSLPERIAHKSHKLQFEVVAVLGLLSLFTHIQLFWVIGLFLALIDIPDFGGWLGRIAVSTEKMAGVQPDQGVAAPAEYLNAQASNINVHPDQKVSVGPAKEKLKEPLHV